jgi:hypothetical protein
LQRSAFVWVLIEQVWGLQIVPLASNRFVGQAAAEPVQFSAMSQLFAAARQTMALETNTSVGHVVAMPVHVS